MARVIILAFICIMLVPELPLTKVCNAMNGNDELPAGHFWDPEEAKREYYKVETGLDETKEKLWQAQARLQIVRVVHDCFLATPSIVVFEPRSIDLDHLNVALNPYWL